MPATDEAIPPSRLERILNRVERVGNRLPDPFYLFVWLFVVLAAVSTAIAAFGVTVTIPGTSEALPIKGLISGEGLEYLLDSAVDNFVSFPPLGNIVMMLMAVGVAERTGLLEAVVRATFSRAPAWLLPYALALVCFQAHVMSDVSVIVIPPLAALVFLHAGRHPVAGAIGAFAMVMGGYGAGVLIGSLDALLFGITEETAGIITSVPEPHLHIAMNWFFTAASGMILPFVGAWILAKVVEPRLGTYAPPEGAAAEADDGPLVSDAMRAGMRRAGLWTGGYVLIAAIGWLIPGSPLRGEGDAFVPSPLLSGMVPLLFVAFMVAGISYGTGAGTLGGATGVPKKMADAVRDIAPYIVLIFAISQVLGVFEWSNVGTLLAVKAAAGMQAIHMTGFTAILMFVLLASVINLFITSGSAMWSLLAPVFVPAFMLLNYDPAFIQAAFRIGDSATQIISPMNLYVYVALGAIQKYEPELKVGGLIVRLSVFVVPFWVIWAALLGVFYFADLPVGPGNGVHLP
ncbi:MAG: AbgT family transporter [Streptosporangiales bacterium]|nr:AbgT family transporter [Streptosporangiales bacterium]